MIAPRKSGANAQLPCATTPRPMRPNFGPNSPPNMTARTAGIFEALGIGADRQWDKFFDAWLTEAGDQWNTPAGRDIVWRSRSRKTPALLVKIITDKSLTSQERDHYFRSLDFITGPEKDAALLQLLTSR